MIDTGPIEGEKHKEICGNAMFVSMSVALSVLAKGALLYLRKVSTHVNLHSSQADPCWSRSIAFFEISVCQRTVLHSTLPFFTIQSIG